MVSDNKEKKFFILIVLVIIMIMISLVLLVIRGATNNTNIEPEETTQDSFVEKASLEEKMNDVSNGDNYDLIYENNGTLETFNELSSYVSTFISDIGNDNYEDAYDLYATELLEVIGYTYSLDDFTSDMKDLKDKILLNGGELCVQCSYYVEYSNYFILHLAVMEKYHTDSGTVYDNAVTMSYTIMKDAKALLDFCYNDLDLYDYRFTNNNEDDTESSGTVIDGVIVVPEIKE